ncbi:MAG TPA: cellulose-binding domain-containing protein [Pseudonocardiaceae bacterium]|nr:cellulose-binding domain-containing protein [Pseudonocardiaceae bacterium]
MVIAVTLAAVVGAGVAAVSTASPLPAQAAGGFALTAPVEDSGAGCAVSLPGSSPANAKLPDPFTRLNGTRITSTSDWTCRREEILQLAEKDIYGQKPAKPASVTGTVSSTNITVNVSDQGKSASFSASVQLPSGTGPFPAVVVVDGLGADTATILGTGVAVINYNPFLVGNEGTPRNAKTGAFYSIYGSTSSTGLLMAWAWGVSRLIDVVQQSGGNILRADAMGVTGCSRFGKSAFVIGAFDQRIALTMPIESGTDGVPILRGVPGESGAQPLTEAFNEQPWVGDAFSAFTSSPNNLPVDTHEMVAMVAPRGLFIMENPHIDWLAARSGSVAALGGAEVYKALGVGANISYWSDVQDATHCAVRPEWKAPLQQSLQKFLLNTGNPPAVFRISSLKAGDLSQWRDWTTPNLTNTPPTTTTTAPTTTATTTTTNPPPTTTTAPPTTTTTGNSGALCNVSDVMSTWDTGFTANLTVTNTGTSAVNGWTLAFTLPTGQTITNGWNASYAGSSGPVTATNLSYNASIPPGGNVTFGFQANHGADTSKPAGFTLNNNPCTTS